MTARPENTAAAFKAYDIRGRVPEDLNAGMARRIGHAFVATRNARTVLIGHDMRLESPELSEALAHGLTEAGADVIDIGLCGTEEVYFGTVHHETDGGIMITASHNPKGWNGMKLVGRGSEPISGDSGLHTIRDAVVDPESRPPTGAAPGRYTRNTDKSAYIASLLEAIDRSRLRPLKIVANPGNGAAGPVLDALEPELPFEWITIQGEPDGNFPHGVPNPLLPEMRSITSEAVRKHGADFGVAWDGDFDRCFLFDEQGRFIEGYYIVGLLAAQLLEHHPGEKIIHDPRLTWNTITMTREAGGTPIQNKTGHAFMKERMRAENALYGGEMSAHHYFRDFAYCDSGMLPWLLVAERLSASNAPLSSLVDERIATFPCSGEINFTVNDVGGTIERILAVYRDGADAAPAIDYTDGVSVEFADWRFNLRGSNTEPVLRLNVETRGDPAMLHTLTENLSQLIRESSQ
ncbi:phosphomannomutase/phosphoglucomutase [Thioalkalivibrio sp. ALJ24]|uniref:phosphomannomutase/phosphoglucomutase n=1 Tax=Thioalkalivibrio sp. ALJ24 TaxID=545276 RepID=UPI000363A118|nr:phosphomannomutase/phosphoglucomutase [Thioalkalivibrio sp. ALJ24]